jgi:hypothetical protein
MNNPLKEMYVTSEYGMRMHPVFKYEKMHLGVDLRAKTGTETMSILNGAVKVSKHQVDSKGNSTGLGSYIVIEHELGGDKFCTMVCHLSKRYVQVGDIVTEGQIIGLTGNSGSSSAEHLHFGIHYCPFSQFFTYQYQTSGVHTYREFKHTIDPMKYFEKEDAMNERISLKFVNDGDIIKDLEKKTVELLSGRLDLCNPYVEEIVPVLYEYCGKDLKYGIWNDINVAEWQGKLLEIGQTIVGVADGNFGNDTATATQNFSGSKVVTRQVAEMMNDKLNNLQVELPPIEGVRNKLNPPNTTLKYGSFGTDVKNVQVIYNLVGFEDCDTDGSFGGQSTRITNKILGDHGLEQNGVYDNRVIEILKYMEVTKQSISYKYDNIYYSEIEPEQLRGLSKNCNGYELRRELPDNTLFSNATFRWYDSNTRKVYPQTAFKAEGETLSNRCAENYNAESSWLGDPNPTFCFYQNGTYGVEVINNIKSRTDIVYGVGGIGLHPIDFSGFKPEHKGNLDYQTSRHGAMVNPTTNRVVIAMAYNYTIYKFASETASHGMILGVGKDSGNSTQGDFGSKERYTTRVMTCWTLWEKGIVK